ncbi:hypothetical protein CDCA_CDCA11G3114 [Cyanidium caldarium]|uniref:Uncharacterized protein n=1 Tax=Cyanidium caldarium TaxID=2771 RepID=A0AAV9IXV3_CYACA|nr:hypothetical protein CDCA_CDCA11G3114 [Cyanidium caldarium]
MQQNRPGYYDDDTKRGLDLLRDDFLNRLPSRFGVGPQEEADLQVAPPQPGEPGYKPPARAQVPVSQTGLSAFRDSPRYVGRAGGAFAVETAAEETLARSRRATESGMPSPRTEQMGADYGQLPPYLQPLPEDTPDSNWVNVINGKRVY